MSAEILEINSLRLLAEAYVREASLLDCAAGTPREEQFRRVEAAGHALRRGIAKQVNQPRPGVFTRILVATDGSPEAQRAELLAAGLASERDGRVMLVCVADTRWAAGTDRLKFYVHDVYEGLRKQAAQTLADAVGRVPPGAPVEYQVREGEPAAEIVNAAQEWGADLLVMGSRGRGRLRGLLLGSTAQEVLHGAKCPVVVVTHAAIECVPQQPRPGAAIVTSPVRPATSPPRRTDVLQEETES